MPLLFRWQLQYNCAVPHKCKKLDRRVSKFQSLQFRDANIEKQGVLKERKNDSNERIIAARTSGISISHRPLYTRNTKEMKILNCVHVRVHHSLNSYLLVEHTYETNVFRLTLFCAVFLADAHINQSINQKLYFTSNYKKIA